MKSHEKFIGEFDPRGPAGFRSRPSHFRRVRDLRWKSRCTAADLLGMERATTSIRTDGEVLKAWRKVKVPKHAQEVLKAATGARTVPASDLKISVQ